MSPDPGGQGAEYENSYARETVLILVHVTIIFAVISFVAHIIGEFNSPP